MITLYNKYKEKGLTREEVRLEARRERQEKAPDDQAATMITGIAALHARLEKIDWLASPRKTATSSSRRSPP